MPYPYNITPARFSNAALFQGHLSSRRALEVLALGTSPYLRHPLHADGRRARVEIDCTGGPSGPRALVLLDRPRPRPESLREPAVEAIRLTAQQQIPDALVTAHCTSQSDHVTSG